MKSSWATVHNILKKPNNDFPQKMIIRNKVLTKPVELADEMNKYFVGKIEELKVNSAVIDDEKEATETLVKYLKKIK